MEDRDLNPSLSDSSPVNFTGAQEHRCGDSPGTGGSTPAAERKEIDVGLDRMEGRGGMVLFLSEKTGDL